MSLEVRLVRDSDREALMRLDARLRNGGASARVYPPDEPLNDPLALPREEQYVAADGEEIRGCVYLRRTSVVASGERLAVGYVKYPVAESLVDRKYAGVPVAMIRHLQLVLPELLVMGMGGLAGPFAQLLARMRWQGHAISTLVLPLRPTSIFRHLPHFASRTMLVSIASMLDVVGVGSMVSVAVRFASALTTNWIRRGSATAQLSVGTSDGSLYDRVFASALHRYPLIAERDANHASWIFPADTQGAHRLHVQSAAGDEGYVHVQYLDFRAQTTSPYGPLRLAVLHDMLAPPEAAGVVLASGVELARQLSVDLVLLTHSHPAWLMAARTCGFLRGPANFACMRSPALDGRLAALGLDAKDMYVTRGDDGVVRFAR